MAKNLPTTPPRGSKTPVTSISRPKAANLALATFDAGLAQMQRLQQAEARLDLSGYNTAVWGCESEAADARAQADTLLMAFYRSNSRGLWHLSNAAWIMLLLLESDGLDLYLIAQRSAGLRRTAAACARSPLPDEMLSADRLLAAAEVIDLMVEAALDDYAEIGPDSVDELRGLVGCGISAAVDRARLRHRWDDTDPDAASVPCAG